MTREKIDELYKKYPKILRELGGDPTKTCMSWDHDGIACDDGWYDLLDTLFSTLQFNTDKNCYPQVIADQIKEKFGGLRFYYHYEDNPEHAELVKRVVKPEWAERSEKYLDGIISFAEIMSYKVCELCGNPGHTTNEGWVRTLCDDCRANRCRR